MRIIQVCGSRSWGGLEMQTLRTAQGLRNRGHDVVIFCTPESMLEYEARQEGLEVFCTMDWHRHPVQSLYRITRFLKNGEWDVIHTHFAHDLWILVPSMNLSRCHANLFLTKRMASGVRKTDLFHRILYHQLKCIFVISNYIRQSVLNTCPVSEDRVFLLHNGIDLKQYDPKKYNRSEMRRNLDLDDRDIVIGMVGRFSPGKGHEEFVRASVEIRNQLSDSVKFVIVGGYSYGEELYFHKIQKITRTLLPKEDVIFTGFRKDIPQLMTTFDVLAFPSHEESLGNILLEAMAMNVPLVACNSGGVSDIVINGETGILVSPKDVSALADAILYLIRNPRLVQKFIRSGRQRVKKHFRFSLYLDRLIEKYEA
jgi:glycosyltransferase involved in cell wall biosynthesis